SLGTIQKAGGLYQVTSDSPPGGDLRSRARSAPPSLPPVLRRGVQAAQQVSPGDVVSVPGVSSVVQSPVALDSSGLLSYALPGDGALALHRRVCHHPVPLPPESLEHGPEPLSIRLRRESRAG